MMWQDLVAPQRGEEGIALVTTLVILLIMTVLGVGAVATTALESRIAGFQRTSESAASAAEACLGTSVNIIKQTITAGNTVPPAFYATANDPVPALAAPTLGQEISGGVANDPDMPSTAPDYRQQINGYDVRGDIDFLYQVSKLGENQIDDGGGVIPQNFTYRIDCRATLTAVGTESRVVAIYNCLMNGAICKAT
jgi:Tfp pilus assembly protein PilX